MRTGSGRKRNRTVARKTRPAATRKEDERASSEWPSSLSANPLSEGGTASRGLVAWWRGLPGIKGPRIHGL